MPRYRELSAGQTFRCAQCGRRKYVKYVPTSELCRDCAAKQRRRIPNVPVGIADDLVVTKAVEKKLTKRAESDIPRSRVLKIGESLDRFVLLGMWISAPFATRALFDDFSGPMWFFVLGWTLLIPYAVMVATGQILEKPRRERKEQTTARVVQLAQERKQRIAERGWFYSSPEWIAIRAQVIEEEGRLCAECGKQIRKDTDVTVDHKQPRSKFPKLALSRQNLRVLCRQCNSRKGADDWLEA